MIQGRVLYDDLSKAHALSDPRLCVVCPMVVHRLTQGRASSGISQACFHVCPMVVHCLTQGHASSDPRSCVFWSKPGLCNV